MSRNTAGIAVGCAAMLLGSIGIALGLNSRDHHVGAVQIAVFLLAAVSTAYLVHRRHRPVAEVMLKKSRDSAYWGRLKAQVYAVIVFTAVGYLFLIWFALDRTVRYHQPIALLLIPASLWALQRVLPAFRKMRLANPNDLTQKLIERGPGPVDAGDGPPPTWSAWTNERETQAED